MKTRGFTLVEVLVSLAIFTIIGGIAFNLLISAIGVQRNALSRQVLVDQTSFVIEYMSRSIRQAQKDEVGSCISPGLNYELSSPNPTEIRFIDKDDNCRKIFLDAGIIKETIITETLPLTSDDIDIQDLRFILLGATLPLDDLQPRVTFMIQAQDQSQNTLILQTTISQRQYDI